MVSVAEDGHLARMELQQLLSALIRHVDSIELAGAAKNSHE